MKATSSVAVAAAALLVLGTTFLLGAVETKPPGCGAASSTAAQGRYVAGYSGDQLDNAAAIMNAATALGLDGRAQLLGVMTAMGESGLRNITYGDYETSGVTNPDGSRTSSIGLFQQQESWGSRDVRLNPNSAATLFFQRLVAVDGWAAMEPSEAIHRVQINSDPNHYTKWQAPAAKVTATLTVPCVKTAGNSSGAGAWGAYENGHIPVAQLTPIPWSDLGPMYLRADAAQALFAMNAAFRAVFGYDLPINDAYRDYDGQVLAKQVYGDEAAEPGESTHGWALAIDVGTAQHSRISFGSATYGWLKANAPAYGWVHPEWAEPGGSGPDEAWHWEFERVEAISITASN